VHDISSDVFGSFRLGGRDGIEGDEHGGVNSTGVVEERADNLLDVLDVGGREKGLIVRFRGILNAGAVDGPGPLVRCVLAARGWRMLEFVECRGNIVWHGEINGAIGVVPVECEAAVEAAAVEAASPVGGDCVKVFECFDEMPCVLVTDVFYAKVIDDKGKGDGPGLVAPEPRGEVGWLVAVLGQVLFKALIGDDASLGQTIHAFSNFDVDPSIMHET
jgi:hypothetical protein